MRLCRSVTTAHATSAEKNARYHKQFRNANLSKCQINKTKNVQHFFNRFSTFVPCCPTSRACCAGIASNRSKCTTFFFYICRHVLNVVLIPERNSPEEAATWLVGGGHQSASSVAITRVDLLPRKRAGSPCWLTAFKMKIRLNQLMFPLLNRSTSAYSPIRYIFPLHRLPL